MNKTVKRTVMALAMSVALCGTAMATPRGNPPKGGNRHDAPVTVRTHIQQAHHAKNPAPQVKHEVKTSPKPQRHEVKMVPKPQRHVASKPAKHHPKPQVAYHNPPPPPPPARHHQPQSRHENCHSHHSDTLHTEDWCEIGASFLGGLVGSLIGASI